MSQSFYEAAPYYWQFVTSSAATGRYGLDINYGDGPYGGETVSYLARRHQEGGTIEQEQPTSARLLTALADYESQLSAKSHPVSPEWGQTYGPLASNRARLISSG